jgi:hypothetical protein
LGVASDQETAPVVSFSLSDAGDVCSPDVTGRTPPELYGYMVLDNPPFSDQMNRQIWQALKREYAETERLRAAGAGARRSSGDCTNGTAFSTTSS